MRVSTKRGQLLLACVGAIAGLAAGAFIFTTVAPGEADRQDFADNAAFLKHGRRSLAVCVSDVSGTLGKEADVASLVENARDDNKRSLWKNSFLESEPLSVKAPCPVGPTVSKDTASIDEYLTSIRVVDTPGPYVLYIFVVDQETLQTLAKLNLERVIPHEFIDPDPDEPAGYVQVAAALYVSREEIQDRSYIARQIAQALGCTEACSADPASGT